VNRRTLRLFEAAFWVTGATTLTVLAFGAAVLLVGGELVTLKYVLFVVGLLLFGFGSFAIQPTRPHQDEKRVDAAGEEPNRYEVRLQRLPPLRGRRLPFGDRVSRNTKLFLTGLATLAVSAAMELLFGVGP
jgi:hypothetical protein